MPLKSMTGFANCSGSLEGFEWRWEIRSVNGRGLDTRFRLSRRDGLEPVLRDKISSKIGRGSIQVSLVIEQETKETLIQINESALDQAIEASKLIEKKMSVRPPSADGLLALPGVMTEIRGELSEEEASKQQVNLLSSFDTLLDDFAKMRLAEGAQIENVLRKQLEEIKSLAQQARENPCRRPEVISEKLSKQISALLQNHSADMSNDRLYAEAALLAVKGDIQEEIDRIEAHTQTALDMLSAEGPIGRKLEFLTQELAREANTLCSKSNDHSLTQTGLTLKTVIDQMREQILNLE